MRLTPSLSEPLVWVIELPAYTIAYKRTDTSFVCQAKGTGDKAYSWYKDGVRLTDRVHN